MGETLYGERPGGLLLAFSILKRIVMGETQLVDLLRLPIIAFQYPQADRDG